MEEDLFVLLRFQLNAYLNQGNEYGGDEYLR